jgi:hypothetical protein
MTIMNLKVKVICLIAGLMLSTSCADYLDLVPEGVATMDNAFSNRVNTEKFLFTCFSRLPNPVDQFNYPTLVGSDEIWWDYDYPDFRNLSGTLIAQGTQEANDPVENYWDGGRGGSNLFVGIRDCNIFLENIHIPYDVPEYEKIQWAAEAKFLKAYLHFFLLELYGPIPIIRENLPVSASPEEVRMYREPVDDVVEYIVELLDEAMPDLPLTIRFPMIDAGRITQPIAAAVKAKALVLAASPLFNGNPDYASFKDNKGRLLISSGAPDPAKWQRAAVAIKEAIDISYRSGHVLYHYVPGGSTVMSPETQLKYTLRGAVTERFNTEIIWPDTHSSNNFQHQCMPLLEAANYNGGANELGATLKIAEQYYTDNGLPIDEDPTWDYENRYLTQVAETDHQYYIKTGQETARLNFRREPRFHASLAFDRGIFEGAGRTEAASVVLEMRQGEASGMRSQHDHNVTGYNIKKLCALESVFSGSSFQPRRYSYPLVRLTDLYLLYAEALNEVGGPSPEVYTWIDTVRLRAGLKGVEASWAKSSVPDKPYTKEGLREIIKRERLIELAFEGQRFWDLRRWKDALKYFSEPVRGWSYKESTVDNYYNVTNIWYQRSFIPRDYLWPLKLNTVIINANLVQNPGW